MLSDDNHTIFQILDIKIHKSGVFQLNIMRFINSSDADTCTINTSVTTTPKIKVLVHLYPGKIVGKLVFRK